MAANYIGSNGSGSGNTSSTTLTFNTTRTIAAGEHVVYCVHSGGGGADPTSITVGSLSLTQDATSGGASQTSIAIYSARATAQINSGSTTTAT